MKPIPNDGNYRNFEGKFYLFKKNKIYLLQIMKL